MDVTNEYVMISRSESSARRKYHW